MRLTITCLYYLMGLTRIDLYYVYFLNLFGGDNPCFLTVLLCLWEFLLVSYLRFICPIFLIIMIVVCVVIISVNGSYIQDK
jgi:hypothetical protein